MGTNTKKQQVWLQRQKALAIYGQKLDIVYNDTTHSAEGKYATTIDASSNLDSNWPLITLFVVVIIGILAVLIVVRKKKKKSDLTPASTKL